MSMRTINISLNVTDGHFMDADNGRFSANKIPLYLGDTLRMTLTLYTHDHASDTYSVYSIPALTTIKAGIKARMNFSEGDFLALSESWTITSNANGQGYFDLSLATTNLDTFLSCEDSRQALLELEFTLATGAVITTVQESVTVINQYIGDAPISATVAPGYYTKTEADARYSTGTMFELTQGQDFYVVTGLALSTTPKYFDVQILIPTNGSDLPSCYQVLDTVSTDGVRINFDSDISGAGYKIGISPRY